MTKTLNALTYKTKKNTKPQSNIIQTTAQV